jgi:hypothetical protein
MEGSGVVLGKGGHRANPKLGGGAHDTDGDFASVGDQKTAGKHQKCGDSSCAYLTVKSSNPRVIQRASEQKTPVPIRRLSAGSWARNEALSQIGHPLHRRAIDLAS